MSDMLTLKFPRMDGVLQSSRIEVSFTCLSDDQLSVSVFVKVGTMELSARTICYGYDLAQFARELNQLHTRYEGSAQFVNMAQNLELSLTLTDKAHGIVSVVLRYDCDNDSVSPIEFRCFRSEQSYLQSIIADVRNFLAESGVSVTHPFEKSASA